MERSQLIELERVGGAAFDDLLTEAARIRDAGWGKVVTYSRKVFIPLTTYCRDDCGYCTFVKRPGEQGAKYMTPDEVIKVAREGRELGCKEALFSLGEKPELRYPEARAALNALGYETTIDYLHDMCAMVVKETGLLPHANPGTMSLEEITRLKSVTGSMGIMMENVSKRLTQKGGPHHACPDKVPLQRIRTLERAGEAGVPFTTGILIGIGETWEERIDTLLEIQRIHEAHGHIQEVIVQNFRAKPGIPMADHPDPSHEDMLRTLAAARLALDPEISLQAPPNLQDRYTDYISAGLNDWGGVSPLTKDFINPERAWPQIRELADGTASMGYQLKERLTLYHKFINNSRKYVDVGMASSIDALVGSDGFAREQFLD